jgi:outer membrane protein OmpA-like peptidoglycan-associated protein
MITFRTLHCVLALLAAFAQTAASPTPASAQLAPFGGQGNVLVDTSVIGGTGPAPQFYSSYLGGFGPLLEPPSRRPISQLLVDSAPVAGEAPVAASRIKLTPPRPAAAPKPKPAEVATREAPPMPKVEARPRQQVESQPPPKPAVVPPSPTKPEAPKQEMTKAEPVKPAASTEEKPAPLAVTPPPAPVAPPAPTTSSPPARTGSADQPPPMPKVTPPKPAGTAAKETPEPTRATEQAARTPAAETPGGGVSVVFGPDAAALPDSASGTLKGITERLNSDPEMRLQLLAYAGGASLSSSKARRLSLERALAVRSYLIDAGIRSSRIDVRALGDKVPDGEPNRVDIRYARR